MKTAGAAVKQSHTDLKEHLRSNEQKTEARGYDARAYIQEEYIKAKKQMRDLEEETFENADETTENGYVSTDSKFGMFFHELTDF